MRWLWRSSGSCLSDLPVLPDLQRTRVDEGGGAAMTPEEVVAMIDGSKDGPDLKPEHIRINGERNWCEVSTKEWWSEARVRDWVKRKQERQREKR